ncbi:MAG: PadR family transcriptional regulator [Gemmatimonadota bacterium]|nr:MAG: PadR family transcriptional regulator [Gemmatimonadota bacterium]
MSRRHRDHGLGGFAAFCGPMGFAFGAGRRGLGFRVFDRGDLKYVILKLLSKKPMHGYEVMRALEEESCGCYSASAGSVYPTLQMLEDQGYVVCEEKEGKKVYSITEEGQAFLEENGDLVDDILDRIASFTDRFFRSEMRDLSGSFRKLAQVTFERGIRWAEHPEELERVKEILDRAAREIEEIKPGAAKSNA